MAVRFTKVWPTDPEFVPNSESRERAHQFLQQTLPELTALFVADSDAVGFHGFADGATWFATATCPFCNSRLDRYEPWLDAEWDGRFACEKDALRQTDYWDIVTGCCGRKCKLYSLSYKPRAVFGRFMIHLEWSKPGCPIPDVEQLQQILGHDLWTTSGDWR